VVLSATPCPTSGGYVTITGSGFEYNISILINNQICALSDVISSTKLICWMGAGQGRNYNVNVTVPAGYSAANNAFSYEGPSITSVSSVGTAGGLVIINGSNFGIEINLVSLFIGDSSYSATFLELHTSLELVIYNGVGKNIPVVVTVAGQSAESEFSYDPPEITSIQSVPTSGGFITIIGSLLFYY